MKTTFRNLWLHSGDWQKKNRLTATNHNIRFMVDVCQGQRELGEELPSSFENPEGFSV
jgi:hypothetical protein